MRRNLISIVAALVAVAGIAAGSILAYDTLRPRERSGAVGLRADGILPLVQILDMTAKHLPGEVLKIELESEHGRPQYEIKVLAANGRVREIKLDARSGALIEIEDD